MKKVYEKPEIVFENFSLSTNIAAGCEYTDPNHPDLFFSGMGYAFTSEANCGYPIPNEVGGDGDFNGICYHVPSEIKNLFNS